MSAKEKYELEFIMKTSTRILYNLLSTPSGLSEWFADNVNIKDDIFTFIWDGSEEAARMVQKRSGESIRFQWLDDEGEDYYFEFHMKLVPLTKEVVLMITDYAEEDEREEAMLLWDSQVSRLRHILGS
ncbi:MAG: START-like domain-containing protein [Bacteroidota bacterium]